MPRGALLKDLVDLPKAQGELEVHRHLQHLAKDAPAGRRVLGAGAYGRRVPASVDGLIQRSEFDGLHRQPEIAQGTLQALCG